MKNTNVSSVVTTSGDVPPGTYKTVQAENTFAADSNDSTTYQDKRSNALSNISLKTQFKSAPTVININVNMAELERRLAIAALNKKQSYGGER
jgi:hypothetical protein